MTVKPLDKADLRKILATTTDKIDELSDPSWVKEISEAEVLQAIQRGTPKLREQVGENSDSIQILKKLAGDSDRDVRSSVAENRSTPTEILCALAKDSDDWIRAGVAWNPSTPADIFDALAKDSDSYVRGAVAMNRSTPTEILGALARDSNSSVREKVAGNPSTPPEIINALAKDSDISVRNAAKERSSCFIATAAIGSYDSPIVMSLQQFRDRILLRHQSGRRLVEIYYWYSPPVADWIEKRRAARRMAKWLFVMPAAMVARALLRIRQ